MLAIRLHRNTFLFLIIWASSSLLRAESQSTQQAKPAKDAASHWAFQPLKKWEAAKGNRNRYSVDRFILDRLQTSELKPNREASREILIRRVAFAVTGLPPTPGEIHQFTTDHGARWYESMVQAYLDSPRFGERWAKPWLDAAGYADSNGYFSADSDRPLAYRYRDYVIRSLNQNKPFDRFVREQIAGDELSGWRPGKQATPEIIELLEATHYLRNGQDGSGESDGNPDEVRTDRYYALESTMQIMGSSLMGLTFQCAKCHDHKFEPLKQQDYYAFQAFLYPAFNIEKWVKPNDRIAEAALPGEMESWRSVEKKLDERQAGLRSEFTAWVRNHRPQGQILFQDPFNASQDLTQNWSNVAPGDDTPGGKPPVEIGGDKGPAARVKQGRLEVIEGGGSGDRWISTKKSFQWRPVKSNDWIQATFDLVDVKLPGNENKAERVGWFIALHDFDDSSKITGGNILIDGNPGGATSVQVDYPGTDASSRGSIGATGYSAGHNYGVRITKTGPEKYLLEHLVDGAPDGASLKLKEEDLPPGGFGFEYCCGRSFVVDNVQIESSRNDDPEWARRRDDFDKDLAERKKDYDAEIKAITTSRTPKPGRIAWVTDVTEVAPPVPLLKRGNHNTPGNEVAPAFPGFLTTSSKELPQPSSARLEGTTGRRLAWAHWLTKAGSVQSALLARVTVNRIWQQYFGVGIVSTPDNLGMSGSPPSHPELLEWLASEFVSSGWDQKHIHRLILNSAAFKRSSHPSAIAIQKDPGNRLLWRFPMRRLEAEAIRDAMLVTSGRLGFKVDGPYVPTTRTGTGEVVIDESREDAFSRSVFLQQKRSQVSTLLSLFDAPSVVFNCTRRADTTMPLQSLSLLNSDFAVRRAEDLARRLLRDGGARDETKIQLGFMLTTGRSVDGIERRAAMEFLKDQRKHYSGRDDYELRVWSDFAQSLFGMNSFLYLE